ncbi:hypothetical protein FNH09_09925 [Streptomyces adustus]|uniref:Carbohydrate kinase PfkB domain-containing protein n=1 Tax=Streptomyces adustus TaxID=1609272 RepID=A0A5N8V9K9_9ACTN|nr:hypothetical protein [Streptomyces adustus]
MADNIAPGLSRLDSARVRHLVEGAHFRFTDGYEAALLPEHTGWTREQLLDRTGTRVITRGSAGADIARKGESWQHVEAVPTDPVADPTGVGRWSAHRPTRSPPPTS